MSEVISPQPLNNAVPNGTLVTGDSELTVAALLRKLRTALRTVETWSYTYFGVLRRSPSLSKLFSVLVSWPLTR